MNLFELFVKIGVDDQASDKISSITKSLGTGLATAAKVGTAAVGAAATGIAALTTAAVNSYAEYEQLVGGVDTLFKDASQKLQDYAANAYKTAGMSANDYMANATAFSASLINSLGGDTEAAAEYANRAMVSMSDNANKMGTSIESIVQTYQSLSRGNFAMLDNLKLGYGGTKTELERLIADAATYTDIQEQMGVTVDASSMSFDNIVNAIAVVQGKLGIAGATSEEAATTIEGSLNSMRAAWANLITGIADDSADFDKLINNLVESAVSFGSNLLPRIEVALNGAVMLIEGLFPQIIAMLPSLIETILPSIVNGAVSIVQTLVSALSENSGLLVNSAIETVMTLANGILSMLPDIIALGMELIVSLSLGIAEAIPELVPTIIDVITQIVDTLTAPEQLTALLDAAFVLITALMDAFLNPESMEKVYSVIFDLVDNLVDFLLDKDNISKIIQSAIQIVIAMGTGMLKQSQMLAQTAIQLFGAVIEGIFTTDWVGIGEDVVNGIWEGLKSMWGELTEWFTESWDDLVGGVKDFLGIHSPSRVFAGIGQNMALGVGEGWQDEFGAIQKQIDGSMQFETGTVDFASSSMGKASAGVINTITSNTQSSGGVHTVNLMLPDNTTLARYYLQSFIDTASANGTPILNPA